MANFRSPKLLRLAKEAPYCMNPACREVNEGQVVACHSNKQRHGKGTGYKAHDVVIYLCETCHGRLDGRYGGWDALQKEQVWSEALYQTFLWLLKEGYLTVNSKPGR